MKIEVMDQQLIDIHNIRNLEYVHFWDLYAPDGAKMLVVPALMIHYDGGKTINLCAKDKYFDTYVKKVVEVYNDEKNNVLEDSLTDPFRMRTSIKIDDRTKQILGSGVLKDINEIYRFYDEKEGYDNSLLFQIDEMKSLIPIIKYHIQKVFGMSDVVITLDDNVTGYRNYYTMMGKVNNIDKFFVLSFNKIDNDIYEISVQGLLSNNVPFNMMIDFSKDYLNVNTSLGDNEVSSESRYLVTNDVVKEIHTIKKGNITIGYENKDLKQVENNISNITDIDSDTNFSWFMLPWGAMYGINNIVNEVSETERSIERHNMYVSTLSDSFIIKEYFSKVYRRNKTVSVDGIEVTLDEIIKHINCVCIDSNKGIYAIETSFKDNISKSGYYSEHLANKYFYHVVVSGTGINGISRDELVSVSEADNILSGVDLLNKANVYRLVKGE